MEGFRGESGISPLKRFLYRTTFLSVTVPKRNQVSVHSIVYHVPLGKKKGWHEQRTSLRVMLQCASPTTIYLYYKKNNYKYHIHCAFMRL